MFIEARKLIGLPLAAMETQSKIGEIREVLIEPENGKLLGFLVQQGATGWRIFSPLKALAVVDVKAWDPHGLVTQSLENLVEPQEIVRIQEVLDKKIKLLGLPAKTESGKNLGKVEDFLIDSVTETVVKIYLQDLLGNSRIFAWEKIIKIDQAVILADETLEPPKEAVGAPA